MDTATFTAFLTYALVMAITPGPNNILTLSCVGRHGLRGSSRLIWGVSGGFVVVMLLSGLFSLTLSRALPAVMPWLVWLGAGYILWLAWHIARSDPASGGQEERPVSFWASLGLQFVNVKIILYGITALSTFVLPVTREPFWLVMISLLLSVIGVAGNLCWALAGQLFQPVFERHGRGLNLLLALLLVWCAVGMFME